MELVSIIFDFSDRTIELRFPGLMIPTIQRIANNIPDEIYRMNWLVHFHHGDKEPIVKFK